MISRSSGVAPHHAVFLIVFPLLIGGILAAAVVLARRLCPALPSVVAVPMLLGSPAQIADTLQPYRELGFSTVLLEPDASRELAPAAVAWAEPVTRRIRKVAANLGVDARTIPIEPAHDAFEQIITSN